jgi:hypothetical protein
MSALAQKPTFALQKAMSALLPIATAKADSAKGHVRFALKRTDAVQNEMSAKGQ